MRARLGATRLACLVVATALAVASGCAVPGSTGAGANGDAASGGRVSSKLPGSTAGSGVKGTKGASGATLDVPGGQTGPGGAGAGPGGTGPGGTGTGTGLGSVSPGGTGPGGTGPGGTGTGPGGTGPGGTGTGNPNQGIGGTPGQGLGVPLDTPTPVRTVPPEAVTASLIGKVKLISDKGGGIVSNNAAGLIGDAGSGLIGDAGSGLIGDAGSGLIGKTKWSILQVVPTTEVALANAYVEVFDAAGNRLLNKDGKAVIARTDASGNYALTAPLPNENLVLRIRLANDVAPGGELRAFLTKDNAGSGGNRAVDIDTASTFGSTYVLEKYVKGRQDVYERLPGSEDAKLHADMDVARTRLAAVPNYQATTTIATVEGLRTQDTGLDTTLVRIEKLLTLGQAQLGQGLPATEVALSNPTAIAPDGAGGFYIGEYTLGRLRQVDAQGAIHNIVAPDNARISDAFGAIDDMALGPDGLLYVVEPRSRRIRKLTLQDTLEIVAGSSQLPKDGPADGVSAAMAAIAPTCMAFGPDGTLYLAEADTVEGQPWGTPGRVFSRERDGKLKQIANGDAFWHDGQARSMAVTPDGAIWIACSRRTSGPDIQNTTGAVMRKKPGQGWEMVASGLSLGSQCAVLAAPDNGVWLAEDGGHKVWKLSGAGSKSPVAGTGTRGYTGDNGPAASAALNLPSGMLRLADGTLYVTDYGNGAIRAIDTAGTIRTVAGTSGGAQSGDPSKIAINSPTGVTFDPQGNMILAENASHTIKRFDGTTLTPIVGAGRGYAGDGGPATQAMIAEPTGVAFSGTTMYFGDHGNHRIRKVDAAGVISTVAGSGKDTTPLLTMNPQPPLCNIGAAGALTVGPDGLPYWSSETHHRVLRLNAQGKVEVYAGALSTATSNPGPGDGGDNGSVATAKFSTPIGLAFDAAGALYVCDAFNLGIRRIAPGGGTITRFAGKPVSQALLSVMSGNIPVVEGEDKSQAIFAVPGSIAIAPDGTIYVGELGSKNFAALGIYPQVGVPIPTTIPARVRKITPAGQVFTVAGPGGLVLNGSDGQDPLGLPIGLALDPQGRLVIVDGANNQVKIVPKDQLGN